MTHLIELPETADLTSPFVELGNPEAPALATGTPTGFALAVPVGEAAVEDVEIEVSVPLLLVRRHDDPSLERRFLLLAHVDPSSLRATLEHGELLIEARRPWAPPRRLPVRSEFLWEGRVAHRPGDPLPPRLRIS